VVSKRKFEQLCETSQTLNRIFRQRPIQVSKRINAGKWKEAIVKILLVEPPVSPFDVPTNVFALTPPHHLERLAGALVSAHDVRIFDMRLEKNFSAVLESFRPQLVGCSCVAANSHLAKQILRRAKEFEPATFTILGGHHPSLSPEACCTAEVDAVVVGEGEETLPALVAAFEHGESLREVQGVAWRTPAGRVIVNPRRPPADLDNLPAPARHLTKHYRDAHGYYRSRWRPVDAVITSRGCPNRCRFCGLWKIHQGGYRFRSPERIVEEIAGVSEPYVLFFDDNTLADEARSTRLAELLARQGLRKKYELYGRADTVAQRPWLVEKWRAAGMELLLIGLEAVDERSLSAMNKRSSGALNRRALEVCRANGVEVIAYFIVDPRFERDDFRRLSDYVAENGLTHPVFTILSPFPGTDLYAEVKNIVTTDGFELFDFYHTVLPTRLPLDEFYEEFLGLYRRAYSTIAFLKGLFQNMSVLSPGMLGMNLRIRRRFAALRSHHEQVRCRTKPSSADVRAWLDSFGATVSKTEEHLQPAEQLVH
jgi:radical SAM superfamily enzyme YgiQ (UPF0313 family)